MSDVGFVSPEMLMALIAAPILAAWLFYREQVRNHRLGLLGFPNRLLEYKRIWLPTLLSSIVLLALARPYAGFREIEFQSFSSDIFVAIDVSESMLVDDVRPSRLMFARRKVIDLLQEVENSLAGSRIALILFSGEAYLYCPPTSDYSVLRSFIQSISPQLISARGSSLFEVVRVAQQTLNDSGIELARVLVLSDGEDYLLDKARAGKYVLASDIEKMRSELAGHVEELGIPIDTIGIGTNVGKPIPTANRSYVKDRKGKIVLSRLRESVLQELSSLSGGVYSKASLGTQDIESLISRIRASNTPAAGVENDQQSATLRKYKVYNELGPVLLMLVLAIVSFIAFKGKLDLLFLFILSLTPLVHPSTLRADEKGAALITESQDDAALPADNSEVNTYGAYKAYKSGDLETALRGFERAYRDDPGSNELRHALASVLYRKGEFDRAAALFDKAARDASNGRSQYEAYYNKGTALLKSEKFKEAIRSFDNALKVKPDDSSATFNREIARKYLEAQKQNQPQEQQDKEKDTQDKKDEQDKKDKQDKKNESEDSSEQEQDNQDEPDNKDESDQNEQSEEEDQQSGSDSEEEPEQDKQDSSSETEQEQGGDEQEQRGQPDSNQSEQQQKEGEQSQQGETGENQKDSTPSQEEQDKSGEQPSGEQQSKGGSSADQPAAEGESLKRKEARAWLESLPDSPVLLHKRGDLKRNRWGITW